MVNKYATTPNCTTGYTTKQDNEIVCMYRFPQEPEFRKMDQCCPKKRMVAIEVFCIMRKAFLPRDFKDE